MAYLQDCYSQIRVLVVNPISHCKVELMARTAKEQYMHCSSQLWLTLQLLPTIQIMSWQLRPYLLKVLLMCCKWLIAIISWIPSANSGFKNNITCTDKSLLWLGAVSVSNNAKAAMKYSVSSVHTSNIRTNLLGSRLLMAFAEPWIRHICCDVELLLSPASTM